MGRKQERLRVKIPSAFQCPISLEVMGSPVSLCTGVTYDRVSIQRWLDTGNTTCPATMLPLPSTDLVPNLTLRRLIHLWSSSHSGVLSGGSQEDGNLRRPEELLRQLRAFAEGHEATASCGRDPVLLLRELADFFSSADVDDFEKNNVAGSGECACLLASLRRKDFELEALEVAVRAFAIILASDAVEESNKKAAVASLVGNHLDETVAALVRVLKGSCTLDPRIDSAMLLESVIAASDAEAKTAIVKAEVVIPELVRLIGPSKEKGTSPDPRAVEAGLGCLDGIFSSAAKKVGPAMVSAGVIPAVTRVLNGETTAKVAASALKIMEAAAGCAEGRAAICEERGLGAVGVVVGKMMKAGKEGAEAAVAVLWAVCHRFRDRRAVDALAGAEGESTKLLLLMQSGCSPAARGMAADLLKIFRVNAKGCLAGYDTKTTHIMPF